MVKLFQGPLRWKRVVDISRKPDFEKARRAAMLFSSTLVRIVVAAV
jgi:hypothetical protein